MCYLRVHSVLNDYLLTLLYSWLCLIMSESYNVLYPFTIQSTSLNGLWTFLEVKISIETGPDMVYMIGKIFLQGVRFDIVYNESVHENMKDYFYLTEFRTKISVFLKTKMEVSSWVIMQTYIYQLEAISQNTGQLTNKNGCGK